MGLCYTMIVVSSLKLMGESENAIKIFGNKKESHQLNLIVPWDLDSHCPSPLSVEHLINKSKKSSKTFDFKPNFKLIL